MNWKEYFNPIILDRGSEYYQGGFVEDFEKGNDYVEATVQGSDEYNVHIDFLDGNVSNMECDCPYATKGKYCKHMAAVLFYMEGSDVETYNSVLNDEEGSIRKLVESANETYVKNFLIDILESDERLYNRFKSAIGCEISLQDMKRYKNQIDQIFRKYAGRDDFVNYYDSYGFVTELEDFLYNDIQGLVDNEKYKETFELTSYIFVKLGNQDMDDSGGESGILADRCYRTWQEVVENSNMTLKNDIFKWCMKNLDGTVFSHMEEYVENLMFENFNEEEFINEKLKFVIEKIRSNKIKTDPWLRDYNANRWLIQYIELLKKIKASHDEIMKFCNDNIHLSEIRQYYVDECVKHKNYEVAIQALKEGKESDDFAANYSMQLKDLYKEIGKDKEYKEELWTLLLKYKPGNLNVFKELKALYTGEEWLDKRELVFKNLPSYVAVGELYKEERLYDRLIKIVLASAGLSMLLKYEKCLMEVYPEELLNKYEIELEDMVVHTTDRKRYRELVDILKQMKKYPNGKKKIDEIVANWISKYKKRRAMMDELRDLLKGN